MEEIYRVVRLRYGPSKWEGDGVYMCGKEKREVRSILKEGLCTSEPSQTSRLLQQTARALNSPKMYSDWPCGEY